MSVDTPKPQERGEGAQLYCPLVAFMTPTATKGRRCLGERCGWWDTAAHTCGILSLVNAVWAIHSRLLYKEAGIPEKRGSEP